MQKREIYFWSKQAENRLKLYISYGYYGAKLTAHFSLDKKLFSWSEGKTPKDSLNIYLKNKSSLAAELKKLGVILTPEGKKKVDWYQLSIPETPKKGAQMWPSEFYSGHILHISPFED